MKRHVHRGMVDGMVIEADSVKNDDRSRQFTLRTSPFDGPSSEDVLKPHRLGREEPASETGRRSRQATEISIDCNFAQ